MKEFPSASLLFATLYISKSAFDEIKPLNVNFGMKMIRLSQQLFRAGPGSGCLRCSCKRLTGSRWA